MVPASSAKSIRHESLGQPKKMSTTAVSTLVMQNATVGTDIRGGMRRQSSARTNSAKKPIDHFPTHLSPQDVNYDTCSE
jgi:hypothetical protein